MIRERPILFSAPMIRAIFEGRKTQTRRIVRNLFNGLAPNCFVGCSEDLWCFTGGDRGGEVNGLRCPFGAPGDRLWVRETIRADRGQSPGSWRVTYQADGEGVDLTRELPGGVRLHFGVSRPVIPSIHMPRWASRLTLEVLSVRVERLQEISEAYAIAEGLRPQAGDGGTPGSGFKWSGIGYEGAIPGHFHIPGPAGCHCNVGGPSPAQCAYRELWDKINDKRAPWASNPWVWVVEFRRLPYPPFTATTHNLTAEVFAVLPICEPVEVSDLAFRVYDRFRYAGDEEDVLPSELEGPVADRLRRLRARGRAEKVGDGWKRGGAPGRD